MPSAGLDIEESGVVVWSRKRERLSVVTESLESHSRSQREAYIDCPGTLCGWALRADLINWEQHLAGTKPVRSRDISSTNSLQEPTSTHTYGLGTIPSPSDNP